MQPLSKLLTVAVVAVVTLGTLDTADAARSKKPRVKRALVEATTVVRDRTFGVPDIMREERPSRAATRTTSPSLIPPASQVQRPVRIPRGSSTYIMPPVPSPNSPNSPPPPQLLQPAPPPPPTPPIQTYGDRVINCIHSAPLAAGVGNNPADRQAYISQCAN